MIGEQPYRVLTPHRDRISAREYNRLTKQVERQGRSGMGSAIADDTGIHTRRTAMPSTTQVRKAYVKTTPAAVETVDCYLDTDATGIEVTVNCSVIGGTALNSAVPRLADGEIIFVVRLANDWWCLTTFQASEDC